MGIIVRWGRVTGRLLEQGGRTQGGFRVLAGLGLDTMTIDNYNITTDAISFEWDENKNRRNRRRHKISFQQAKTAFADVNALLIHDPDHSDEEDRFILMGFDAEQGLLVVCHVYREDDRSIRIISARRASRTEERQYWERWRK